MFQRHPHAAVTAIDTAPADARRRSLLAADPRPVGGRGRLHLRRLVLAAAFLAAAAASPLAAQPALETAVLSFVDLNGNGVLDCGEPVVLAATYATRNSGNPALTGSLLVPYSGTVGLIYQPGTLRIDPDLSAGCQGTITRGNSPEDLSGEVDFSCPADPLDNNSWTLVVTWRALYDNPNAAAFTATAHATTSDGRVLDAATRGTAAAACPGSSSHVGLQKTAAGTGAPGSVLRYTLTATDLSGLGDGGLQLVDTVPANTRFDAAASDAGWACTPPDGGAGALCKNQVGNLSPGGSLARTFAVTVASPLPAGVTSIANTGCVLEGPATVAACASVSTPTSGAPALAVAKTLVSGTGAPGATLVYDLAARNTGNQGATAVTLGETVPAATTLAAAASSPGWSCLPASGTAGAACTLQLGALAAGAAAHAAFAVTLASPLPAGVSAVANTGCATAPGLAPVCATVSTPTLGQPRLALAKTYAGPPLSPGALLPFQLAYANTGNQDTGAVLTETVPAATTFAPAGSSAGWICAPAAGGPGAACTLALGTLAAGGSGSRTFAVRAASPLPAGVQQIANTACLQRLPLEAGAGSVCSQAETPPPPPPPPPPSAAVAATLADTQVGGGGDGSTARPNDPIFYALVVTNPSAAAAHDLRIAVALDPLTRLQAGSVSVSSLAATVLLGNGPGDSSPLVALPVLDAGASLTVTFRVIVAPALPAGLANLSAQATVSGSDVATTLSDDPATPAPLDPTLTPVAAPAPPPGTQGIPTLGGAGLSLLVVLLAAAALARLRRRQRAAAAAGAAGAGATAQVPSTCGNSRPR